MGLCSGVRKLDVLSQKHQLAGNLMFICHKNRSISFCLVVMVGLNESNRWVGEANLDDVRAGWHGDNTGLWR